MKLSARYWAALFAVFCLPFHSFADAVVNQGAARFTSFIVTDMLFTENIYTHSYQATINTQYITKANLDKIAVMVYFRPKPNMSWTALPFFAGGNAWTYSFYEGQVIINATDYAPKEDIKIVIIENK